MWLGLRLYNYDDLVYLKKYYSGVRIEHLQYNPPKILLEM